jgi:hypothetical protein
MEEAPSRLPSHHPYLEAFRRYFQPPADTRFYAGVDLHARSLFLCILDRDGQEFRLRHLPEARADQLADVADEGVAMHFAHELLLPRASCFYPLHTRERPDGSQFRIKLFRPSPAAALHAMPPGKVWMTVGPLRAAVKAV